MAVAQEAWPAPAKVTRYAQRLLARYDTLQTGQLEREEWHGKMAGKPQTIDIDGDGIITLDELTRHIVQYAWAHPFMLPTPADELEQISTFTPVVQEESPEQEATEVTPPETTVLPSGHTVPTWYVELDADGDGQVTLLEFAPDLTTARLAEFGKQDLNGDGVLTVDETVVTP